MYVRPILDYGDVIFHDQLADMMNFLESIQYQAGLIVTNCWKGTSKDKLYNELGWESLAQRRIFRRSKFNVTKTLIPQGAHSSTPY